ncbi:unnamed protein product, partial [Ectocarpus sp. 12 AP-2014]
RCPSLLYRYRRRRRRPCFLQHNTCLASPHGAQPTSEYRPDAALFGPALASDTTAASPLTPAAIDGGSFRVATCSLSCNATTTVTPSTTADVNAGGRATTTGDAFFGSG